MQRMGMVLGLKPEGDRGIQAAPRCRVAGGAGHDRGLQHQELLDLPEASRRTCCSPTSNITAPISPPTWPRWRPTRRRRNGGRSACPCQEPLGDAQGGRMVGDDGRGVPSSTESTVRLRPWPRSAQSWPQAVATRARSSPSARARSSATPISRPTGKPAFRSPASTIRTMPRPRSWPTPGVSRRSARSRKPPQSRTRSSTLRRRRSVMPTCLRHCPTARSR